MPAEIYLIAALVIIGFAAVFWLVQLKLKQLKEASKPDESLMQIIESLQKLAPQLQKNLQDQSKNISDTLNQSTKTVNERLDNAAKYISQVSKEIGQMSQLGQSMRELQTFLQSPKLRGNIGEQVLKDLISQSFPKESFHLQYGFKSGVKVDAVIKTSLGLLPIDSKFPLENFKKMTTADTKADRVKAKKEFVADVKKHIKAIAQKYILPEEGTLDSAIMYVPSEVIYHEIASSNVLSDFANKNNVYPVSPNSFNLFLKSLLFAFEGQKIEARAKRVFTLLKAIQGDYVKTGEVIDLLGKHLNNAYNQFNNVNKSFSLLGQKLETSNQLGAAEEPKKLS